MPISQFTGAFFRPRPGLPVGPTLQENPDFLGFRQFGHLEFGKKTLFVPSKKLWKMNEHYPFIVYR